MGVNNEGKNIVIDLSDLPDNSEAIYEENPRTGEWEEFVMVDFGDED